MTDALIRMADAVLYALFRFELIAWLDEERD